MAFGGPAIAIGNIIQTVVWNQLGNQAGLNVVHWKVTALSVNTPNVLGRFADGWGSLGFPAAYKALMASAARFSGVLYRIVYPALSAVFADPTGDGAGGVAGDVLPKQVAGFLRKQSAAPGRRKSGRLYIPFPGEGDNEAGAVPSAAYISRLDTLGSKYASQIGWGADDLGRATIIIYKRTAPLTSSAVSSMVTIPQWATQRRRGAFGRPNVSPF